MDDEVYQYTEEDVEKALHFLSTNLQKYATPENAIKVLVYMHKHAENLETLSLEEIDAELSNLESY